MPGSAGSAKFKSVLEFAREEAGRRGDRRIGTDHLLLALLHDGGAPPARALGVTLAEGHSALDSLDRAALASIGIHVDGALTSTSARGRRWITLNSSARAAVAGAKRVAEGERKGRRIEPRHLLLSLLALRPPDPGAELLNALALPPAEVRQRLAPA